MEFMEKEMVRWQTDTTGRTLKAGKSKTRNCNNNSVIIIVEEETRNVTQASRSRKFRKDCVAAKVAVAVALEGKLTPYREGRPE